MCEILAQAGGLCSESGDQKQVKIDRSFSVVLNTISVPQLLATLSVSLD